MNPEHHPLDLLVDLLDGRLADEARRTVDEHVQNCVTCQRELAMLGSAKRTIARLPQPALPEGLEARVLHALDTADAVDNDADARAVAPPAAQIPSIEAPVHTSRLRPWLAVAGIAAALLLAVVLWWQPSTELPSAAAAHVRAYGARQLTMTSSATTADDAQRYLAQRVAFPVRVFDLGMMGYSIAGADVIDLGGRRAAVWVYRSEAGSLLCEMFLATLDDLPAADETRVENDITFRIYHRDGGTQVFWEEGDVLCVLASTLPSDDVVQLAIAKAMKP